MKNLLLALLSMAITVCFCSCRNDRISESFLTNNKTVSSFSEIDLRMIDNVSYQNNSCWNPEMSYGQDTDYMQEPNIISIVW